MLILDANVVVSAVLGRSRSLIRGVLERGIALSIPDAQLDEARVVVTRLIPGPGSVEALLDVIQNVYLIELESYAPLEARARERLSDRGQADWPVLASALALDADIWSNDRDFFGVGVAVWTTPNVRFAPAETA